MRSEAAVESASELAHEIARAAVWLGDRCSWVGGAEGERGARERVALGVDLYGGTAGVALALACAATALGDARLRTTARAAIAHACDGAERLDPGVRDGLHAGPIGVAYAAARVAHALGCEPTLVRARAVLAGWRDGRGGGRPRARLAGGRGAGASVAADVFGGRAGAVLGLLAVDELVDEPWLVDAAAALGRELVAGARRSATGWSWPAPGRRGLHDLCGYAHGAAGVGHALAELHGATGDPRFREAALEACRYERAWHRERGAWPDLREVGRRARRRAPVPDAGPAWCRGAAGIAIARTRTARLLGDAAVAADAAAALADLRAAVARWVERVPRDGSLCHGAAGAVDALVYAAGAGALARRVGARVAERARSGAAPPDPGLFVGAGGALVLCLRLHDPRLATPLAIHRTARLDPVADLA